MKRTSPLDDHYILVNYHYIEDPRQDLSGIHPCLLERFKRQMKLLSHSFDMVSIAEVFEVAQARKKGRFCAITFDDGLKSHYENVPQILKEYRIQGSFFPISSTWVGKVPSAHKTHILLSRLKTADLIDLFHKFLAQFYKEDVQNYYQIPKEHRLIQRRLHEDIATANLKETFLSLPDEIREQFLGWAFKGFNINEKLVCEEFFMTEKEVQGLYKMGFEIGIHSHWHHLMENLSGEFLKKDIELSKKAFNKILGKAPTVFSYPHGRCDDTAVEVVRKEEFQYAVTTERRQIQFGENRLLIPRFDANDID